MKMKPFFHTNDDYDDCEPGPNLLVQKTSLTIHKLCNNAHQNRLSTGFRWHRTRWPE